LELVIITSQHKIEMLEQVGEYKILNLLSRTNQGANCDLQEYHPKTMV
jgi:hypothetical protein